MNDERSRAARAYLETKIRSASPAELISLLYEGLARELRCAAACVDRGDIAERGTAIGRALGILGELRNSLNHEAGGEVATNLEKLYVYWTSRITDANVRSVRAPLDQVIGLLEPVRVAWNESVMRAASAAAPASGLSDAGGKAGAPSPAPGAPSPAPGKAEAIRVPGKAEAIRPPEGAAASRPVHAPGTQPAAVSVARGNAAPQTAGAPAGSASTLSIVAGRAR